MIENLKKIADIASRNGKVPPLYLFIVYVLPGAVYFKLLTGSYHFIPFIVVSVSILPLMAATNLFDDYFDYKYGIDRKNSPNTRYRKHPVFYYNVDKTYLLKWALVFSASYFLLFAMVSYLYGYFIFILAIIGFILGYGYTGPPFGFKYKSLGEIIVAISAIIISLMIFYSESGKISIDAAIFSIPYSVILVPVLFLGNYRDLEYDRGNGIKTLPIIMGKKFSRIFPFLNFLIFYILIIIYTLFKIYPILSLASLATIPLSFYATSAWMNLPDTKFENFIGNTIFIDAIFLSFLLALS